MEAMRREAGGIVGNALLQGDLSQGDRAYLAQLVAARTGLSPADAEQRVTRTITAAELAADAASAKAREAAEVARKVSHIPRYGCSCRCCSARFVPRSPRRGAGASAIRRCTRADPSDRPF